MCYNFAHKQQASEYRKNNRSKINQKNKQWIINNPEKYKAIAKRKAKKRSFKLNVRIRNSISKAISTNIRNNNGNKNYKSILKFLPFSIEDLKNHLGALFEPWMNWSNWGRYISDKWNDNDISSWTWQIDHIVPHSTFQYKSMDCEEFRKCWSLDNLRPYAAKQNILDGASRIRHK
jgi:hypothetical protein